MSENNANVADGCAGFGATQKWAVCWFLCIVFGGSYLVYQFSIIDSLMYKTGGEYMDVPAYKENRYSSSAIKSEDHDSRIVHGE